MFVAKTEFIVIEYSLKEITDIISLGFTTFILNVYNQSDIQAEIEYILLKNDIHKSAINKRRYANTNKSSHIVVVLSRQDYF